MTHRLLVPLIPVCLVLACAAPPARLQEPAAKEKEKGGAKVKDDESIVAELIAAHNKERAAKNLPPLKANPKLEAAARVQARDMAEHQRMSHTGSDGSTSQQRIEKAGYKGRRLAENVAYGQKDAAGVMGVWMDSPGHRANILGDFDEIGVARVDSEEGIPYWSAEFGLSWPKLDAAKAEEAMIEAINAARVEANKPRVKSHRTLMSAARRHAAAFAAKKDFRETDEDGLTPVKRVEKAGYRFAALAESDASGIPEPKTVVERWLAKEASRDTLLGDFSEAGTGVAAAEDGVPYWCILLAKPRRR